MITEKSEWTKEAETGRRTGKEEGVNITINSEEGIHITINSNSEANWLCAIKTPARRAVKYLQHAYSKPIRISRCPTLRRIIISRCPTILCGEGKVR